MSGGVDGSGGFTTHRYRVRPLAADDLEDFHDVWSDPAVIWWGATENLATSRRLLREFLGRRVAGVPGSGWCGIWRRRDGVYMGDVVLQPGGWDDTLVEIGWHLAVAHQHRGCATEAATGMLAHAARHGVDRVWAAIVPANTASQAVARRLGMAAVDEVVHAGRPHHLWAVDLTTHDDPA